jgi:DNA invertase Pin-like site-specific DNA recombinase
VIAKLNRLSRSVADFAQVLRVAKKQRWSVVALDLGIDTSTVNGRFVVTRPPR